jgi:ArsR family transcriptional regulator
MSLADQVDILSVLADESRVRLCALLHERELSVSDLVRITGLSQSRVSSHLGRLRDAAFVRDRRAGQHTMYALAKDTMPKTASLVLRDLFEAADATLRRDKKALERWTLERRGALPANFAGETERHYSPGRTWPALAMGLAALLELGDVLDLGSGDGSVAALLAPRVRKLVCVDHDPTMVEAAAQRLQGHAHVETRRADAARLPFAKASFDAALLFHSLTYMADPAKALAECRRVLRRRGRVVVLSLAAHEHADVTAPYGERHPGFAPARLGKLFRLAGFASPTVETVWREQRAPHFQVLLAVARVDALADTPSTPRRTVSSPSLERSSSAPR